MAAVALAVYAATIGGGADRNDSGSAIGAPLCRGSQLSASALGMNGGAFGTMNGDATLTNVSNSRCALPSGRPRVRILWRGRIVPTREINAATGGSPLPVLAAHSRATVLLSWGNWCGKPSEGTISWVRPTFLMRFAGGLKVAAPGSVATPPGCTDKRTESVIAVGTPVRLRF